MLYLLSNKVMKGMDGNYGLCVWGCAGREDFTSANYIKVHRPFFFLPYFANCIFTCSSLA